MFLYTRKHVACLRFLFGELFRMQLKSSFLYLYILFELIKCFQKQLYQEQISMFKEKQHEEIVRLESELKKTQSKLRECEAHIKSLTAELWTVGEKYIMKKDEADWLRKKQRSGSLMSLQHVHSVCLSPYVTF